MKAILGQLALTIILAGVSALRVHADDASNSALPSSRQAVIVIVGAPGTDEYDAEFARWAAQWQSAAERAGAELTLVGQGVRGEANDRTTFQKAVAEVAGRDNLELVWLVLIGHGSYDGETAKFNLRGPDATLPELAAWLAPVKAPLAIINCASASAPFVNELSAKGRVVIAATKSGYESNYARFGGYLAAAIDDPQADLDKDGQTSLLEAYLTACRGVAEFYSSEHRLASEHALLDDNGDALGTPAEWFRGLRTVKQAKEGAALDGLHARQVHLVPSDREASLAPDVCRQRDALELKVAALRDRKESLGDDAYYDQLEPLLIELAKLYAQPAAAAK